MAPGINSSICVAGMGMGAAEKSISTIGHNLSNANTIAFKAGRADFSTLLYYNISYGSQVNQIHTAGSNPVQIGMGVQLAGVSTNMTQGTIKGGFGKNDLAISGEGFMIARYVDPDLAPGETASNYYTRNGILKLNSEQQLATEDGMLIMGYGINDRFEIQKDELVPLDIPIGGMNIAEATRNVEMQGILDAVGPVAEQGTVIRTKQMTDLSWSSPAGQALTATQIPPTDPDQGELNGSYTYYVTYVDADGNESRPSEISAARNVEGGQLLLSDLPTYDPNDPENAGSNGDWIGRRIYRSTGTDATTYYRLAEIDNMDAGATWIDGMSDSDLVTRPELCRAGGGAVLVNEGTLLTDVGMQAEDGTFQAAFQLGPLYFQPEKGTTELKEQTMEITATGTVRDYLDFLDDSYGIRPAGTEEGGIPVDQGPVGKTLNGGSPGASVRDGALYVLGNAGVDNALVMRDSDIWQLKSAATPGDPDAVEKVQRSLGWASVQDAKGTSTTSTLLVYDSLGAPVEVNVTLVLEKRTNTETTYRWYADSAGNQPGDGGIGIAVGTGQIRFGQNGELLTLESPAITIERTDVASQSPATFTFDLNVGGVSALATGEPSLTQTAQDGAGAGTLWDYEFDTDGTIIGLFTSGVSRPIGQVALATFANPEGLLKMGENLYDQSMNSGPPVIRTPGTDGAGSIKSYSLEMSNTDIASDLIDMILASAMYRANTKVLTTSTEMFDQLMTIR